MRRAALLLAVLLLLWPSPAWAAEGGADGEYRQLLESAQLSAEIEALDEAMGAYIEGFSLSSLWRQFMDGERALDFRMILTAFLGLFCREAAGSGYILGQMLLMALFCLLLTLLKGSFAGREVAQLSRWVVYMLLAVPLVTVFTTAMSTAREAVLLIADFIYVLLPVLLPLLAAIGGGATVAAVNPALMFALALLINLISNVVFPLIYFSAILRLAGQLSPAFNVSKLAGLFKDIGMGLLSICVTVFIGFLSLSGMAAAAMDGLAVKAAKSASGAFIPLVGRSLADAMDSVLGTALVLKNLLGLAGAVIILFICALPAIKILVQVLLLRLTAALIQPLGEDGLAEALSGVAASTTQLFAVVAVCGLFAFFAVSLVVGAGNITMMMR